MCWLGFSSVCWVWCAFPGVSVLGWSYVCACHVCPVCYGMNTANRCLWFGFDILTAQGALPLSTGPRILLDVPTEEQPSYQPAGQRLGTEKNGGFRPPFGRQGGGVVICPPIRMGYPNLVQATTFGAAPEHLPQQRGGRV